MQEITTFLMFTGKAEEAINFYVSVFPNSSIVAINRYAEGEPGVLGTVKHATFILNGLEFMAIDSYEEHGFTFTPSISLFVNCKTEKDIDELFARLSQDGQVLMPLDQYPFSQRFCWINDKFGVSWQLSLPLISSIYS
jgi:predicted 3-demethylubiquinone-9 3-methyltransferase (glyoxalase superfamily)